MKLHTHEGLQVPTAAEPAALLRRALGSRDIPARPLPAAERARLEGAFGRDLSPVRLHSGPGAASLTVAEGASAVTIGSNIFFGPRSYAPGTSAGDRLLAHEVAHVIQQRGGGPDPGGPVDAERGATEAASAVVDRGRPALGLRAAPVGVARQQQTWGQAVAAAQAETDPARKRAAMLALVRRALPGRTVHEAGTSNAGAVDPADYAATPAINFDLRLNSKQRRHAGTAGRTLTSNVGYTFDHTSGGTRNAYSILGPLAVDASGGETKVQMYADHELFHAGHPTPTSTSESDDEVAAWTDTFVHYFLSTYMNREGWIPLVGYYEGATASARTAAADAIVVFANGLATTAATGERHSDRQKLETWLRRRLGDSNTATKQLMVDLSSRLGVTATPPASHQHSTP